MPIINAVLGELDHEAKVTTRVLERVPAEQLSWTPHVKSSSLGKLAWHIASIPKVARNMLRVGTYDVGQARPPRMPENAGDIVAEFQRNHAETREYLATLTDEFLHEPFTMTRGETTVVTIPKIAVIRNILMNHTYHHRGQLTVYLRLLDIPLPAVYGTSADEQM
jgi:uncharacterized damage-inducible protein DinB